MFVKAIADFFKLKLVGSIVVFSCWPQYDRLMFIRNLNAHGLQAAFSCNDNALYYGEKYKMQGVLVFEDHEDDFHKANAKHFTTMYKWLIIGDCIPKIIHTVRYDADVTILKTASSCAEDSGNHTKGIKTLLSMEPELLHFDDIYVHLRDGASTHPWAIWSKGFGLQTLYEAERIRRRLDLKKYPFRIATPIGHFADGNYRGSIEEYLHDDTQPEVDSSIRIGYAASAILAETLNAQDVLVPTRLWTSEADNSSMLPMIAAGKAELGGGLLRILRDRIEKMDYVMPIWPFSVGFTYLAERESSGNMFLEPFSPGVWWSCLGCGVILAIMQRITARHPVEKHGAFYTVLATCLQQDASAVPEGASGRWTFMVLSICSMLVYAYYTSAIVSALMSAGRSGPSTLRELADSKYAITSDTYDYMKYYFFDRNSNWDDMEYLKKKKMTTNLYQTAERGVKLIGEGNTAYHTEYNSLYPLMKSFTDDQICKLAYVDTFPLTLAWVVTTKDSQFTTVMRTAGTWLRETGITSRLVSKWHFKPAPCRASLLAERVKFLDVAPLMGVTAFCAFLSIVILLLEILFAKWHGKKTVRSGSGRGFVES